MLAGNAFKFHANATWASTYVIDYSPDFHTWTPFATNGFFSTDFTNAAPGVNPRFYRMREIP